MAKVSSLHWAGLAEPGPVHPDRRSSPWKELSRVLTTRIDLRIDATEQGRVVATLFRRIDVADAGGMSGDAALRAAAMEQLPATLALVVRLHDSGASRDEIAEWLGVEVVAVAPLVTVAEAKLAAILAAPDPTE